MPATNEQFKVFHVYNLRKVPTARFRENQKWMITFWVVGSLTAWLVNVYLGWNTFTAPNLFRAYIEYSYDIAGTEAIIVSKQKFLESGWVIQQLWWIGDFVREAISRWYNLPLAFLYPLLGVTALSICLREVFGYNLFPHNEQRELLFVEIDLEQYQSDTSSRTRGMNDG